MTRYKAPPDPETATAADHAQVSLPPPLLFLGYFLGALLMQWAVPFPFPWPVPLRILGALLLLSGLALAFSSVRAMRRMQTVPDPHQPVAALVTVGPYRFTRNPIYTGFLLMYLGLTLLFGTLWGLILSPFLLGTVTRWIVHPEEDYLERKFGEDYRAYRARVHRWV